MRPRILGLLALAAVTAALLPDPARGQAGGAPGSADADGDTIRLVFEREVFHYPEYGRRNPFRPLTGDDDAGPRFEDLILLGVILAAEARSSVALVGIRGGPQGGDSPRTYRVREGDRVGVNRVVEIGRRHVLLEVEEFGMRETRALELQRRAPGAQRTPGAEPGPGPPADPLPDTLSAPEPPEDGPGGSS